MASIAAILVAASFLLSVMLCGLARWLAPKLGLVDRPGGHKGHRAPTPLGGGIAIWLTMILVLVAGFVIIFRMPWALPESVNSLSEGLQARQGELAGLMVLASLVMLMGLADDRKPLSWKLRLGVQVALATIVVVAWGSRLTLFLPPSVWTRYFTGFLTVFWIVGLTNSFNFLDNMDGLAASVGLIAASLFAAAQVAVGSLFVPAVLLVLVGALAGFLVHNWHPARLFMGDAGSNFLGFLLGSLTVTGTFSRPYDGQSSAYSIFAPLLVMAVPLYDMTSVIWIRVREGRSPFQPDRRHFSHRLVQRGLTPAKAVATIDLVTLACGLGALLLHRTGDWGALLIMLQTLCLLGVVAILEASSEVRSREG